MFHDHLGKYVFFCFFQASFPSKSKGIGEFSGALSYWRSPFANAKRRAQASTRKPEEVVQFIGVSWMKQNQRMVLIGKKTWIVDEII